MRRLLFILCAASLSGLGCTSTGKKPAAPTGFQGKDDSAPFWSEGRGPKNNSKGPSTEVDGMLAGMLIDSSGRAQPNAVINVTPADAGPGAKPIGIQSDDQGYFMIKGLKTGTTYFLSVRGDDRGKVLGGSAMTEATNTRLLIRLSEGNVSSITPPPVPHPGETGPFAPEKNGKTKLVDPPTSNVPRPDPVPVPKDPLVEGTDQSWSPGKSPPSSRPLPPPPPPASRGNPNVADTATKNWPPAALIPGSGAPKIELPPPPTSPSMSAVPSNSSPLVNTSIQERPRINLTLYDFRGEPVEFRNLSDRRLIVLDFWFTTCPPCLQKIPELINLQSRYTNYIDVIGIDCDNLPWAERTKAVEGIINGSRKTRPINYRMYFEKPGQEGLMRKQFRFETFPTLILLDHSGKELWRGSNTPQLEEAIKFCLRR